MTLEHIVLTTDLSDESRRAFAPVGELALKTGARITVLHVVPEQIAVPYGYPYVPPSSPADLAAYRNSVEKRLAEFVDTLPEGVNTSTEIVESSGRIDHAVCSFVEKVDADAIAMATHGNSGIRRFFLGSVAETVMRSSHVPVFLYPPVS